jgi:putative ABC transport system permease protein
VRLAEQTYAGLRISVDSLDDAAFTRREDFRFAEGDPTTALAAVRDGRGVLVSKNFARQFQVKLGGTLRLDTPAGQYAAPVVGVVVDYVSPRGSVVLARDTYQHWWGDRSVNRFHVFLDRGASVDAVRQAIAAGIGVDEGLTVRTERELWAYHQDAVRRAFRFTRALEILPLLVAGLGLAEALLAVVLDRRREFALLRAAGATRGQLVRSVVTESAGVGLLGLAGGIGMGLVLALLWVRFNFAYQIGWDLDLHFAPGTLLLATAAALLVSVPAGLLPARRIARLQVMAALREE